MRVPLAKPPSPARSTSLAVLVLAYAAFVSLGLPDGLTGVAWPSLRTTFDLPLDALGALITSTSVAYLATSFASGRLVARMGIAWLLILSCLATAVSLLGYAGAPGWAVMVGLGLVAGAGAGGIDAGLNTYAAENFSPRSMNWMHAFFGVGAAAGPLIMSGFIGAGQSWRLGYATIGFAQVALLGCFFITRQRWRTPDDGDGTPAAAPLLQTLRLPSAWLGMLLFFVYAGVELTAGQWLYSMLTEERGLAPRPAGAWVAVFWGSLTVGRLVSGAVVMRIGVVAMLRVCIAGALLGTAMLVPQAGRGIALAGVVLLGLSLAPMFPSLVSLTPQRVGMSHSANAVGFQMAAGMAGGAAFVSGFGLLADGAGLDTLGLYLFGTAIVVAAVFEVLEWHTKRGVR